MTPYERALQRLAQVPLPDFIAERRRLAAELREQDKGAAARLEERRKPTASTWVVNQLYWQARDRMDALLAAAERLRAGEVDASRAYRRALTDLRDAAITLLRESGLGGGDATLRKVAATLSAIGAAGGWTPNPPGALEHDLDAPGFEAMGAAPGVSTRREGPATGRTPRPAAPSPPVPDRSAERARARARESRLRADERARARAAQAEEKERQRTEAARRAELSRATRSLQAAKHKVVAAEADLAASAQQLAAAQERARQAREHVEELERRIGELERAASTGIEPTR